MMLLSAAFPVALWRVRGMAASKLKLESGNHGNHTVLMYKSNKKQQQTSECVEKPEVDRLRRDCFCLQETNRR